MTDLDSFGSNLASLFKALKSEVQDASVEAAHAGHHGRGFAVVAEEVKNLAEMTQIEVSRIDQVSSALMASFAAIMERVEVAASQSAKAGDLGMHIRSAEEKIQSFQTASSGLLSDKKTAR